MFPERKVEWHLLFNSISIEQKVLDKAPLFFIKDIFPPTPFFFQAIIREKRAVSAG
jgi:hypothetical protein